MIDRFTFFTQRFFEGISLTSAASLNDWYRTLTPSRLHSTIETECGPQIASVSLSFVHALHNSITTALKEHMLVICRCQRDASAVASCGHVFLQSASFCDTCEWPAFASHRLVALELCMAVCSERLLDRSSRDIKVTEFFALVPVTKVTQAPAVPLAVPAAWGTEQRWEQQPAWQEVFQP